MMNAAGAAHVGVKMACQQAEHAVRKAGQKQLGARKYARLREHARDCQGCWDYIFYVRWGKPRA